MACQGRTPLAKRSDKPGEGKMDSLASYFSMGGYAGYVWSAYAITAVVMVALALLTWRGLKGREQELKELQDIIPGRRGRSHDGVAEKG